MYKKQKKQLKSFLNLNGYNDELFSRDAITTIIRALLEPVANQNAASLVFTRLKNKEGLEGLIRRLEYCNNVEITDVTAPNVLIKDDYVELEFIIFTSARYNFALLWDYSENFDKNYTNCYFLANSRGVNDVFEILQSNMNVNYKEKFYLHKPERRENELLNEALFNLLKKLNKSIEENTYVQDDEFIVDLSNEDNYEEKIKHISHEIKNQLSIMDVYLKIIEKKTGGNENLDVIKKAFSLINVELNELKNFNEIDIKEIILQDVVYESASMMKEVLNVNGNKIKCETDHKFDIKVFADENKLLSVLNNILKNANESTKNDEITLDIKQSKNCVYIDITNHGEKIKEENFNLIFKEGFTTKKTGSGMGLSGSIKFLKEIKGNLELLCSDENKTTFRITLSLN